MLNRKDYGKRIKKGHCIRKNERKINYCIFSPPDYKSGGFFILYLMIFVTGHYTCEAKKQCQFIARKKKPSLFLALNCEKREFFVSSQKDINQQRI